MIGIIGNGFVGNAVYQNLRDKVECKVYDVVTVVVDDPTFAKSYTRY